MCGGGGSLGAQLWATANPGAESLGCCWGDTINGPEGCTCWKPIFDVDQQPAKLLSSPDDLKVAPGKCHDCAFRRGSPERDDDWTREHLYGLAQRGEPFWCHQGMRRPVRWEHPDGRTIAGDPANWQPLMVGSVPHRADGAVAELCAGWAAVAVSVR